jgi:flagellar hook-basal body complex protein FliE
MDIRSTFAGFGYGDARKAIAPSTDGQAPPSTGGVAAAVKGFADTMRAGEDTALQALAGNADPHSLVQALAQTQLAVETAVTLRDKVVEAYQEIIRMPV